ncbi:MAG: PspA/IM30 family protein [Candidatus Schekmanbacteria bacterium]|nr:PspA/IM30 family protein [Candidatus Schekmanbacteria bacterium]
MGFFSRISDVFRANVNDMIDRAEDPEKMLDQALRDMQSSYQKAKTEVAKAIADKKKLELSFRHAAEESLAWEKKAMMAVEAGKDDLAREALARKRSGQQLADNWKSQLDEQSNMVEQLKTQLRMLEGKIEEARRKKNLLQARARRAAAQQKIHATMASVGDTSAFDTFARLEAKVVDIEARAAAVTEVSGDTLDDKFAALEAGPIGVDDDLLALKAKMGLKELPESTS